MDGHSTSGIVVAVILLGDEKGPSLFHSLSSDFCQNCPFTHSSQRLHELLYQGTESSYLLPAAVAMPDFCLNLSKSVSLFVSRSLSLFLSVFLSLYGLSLTLSFFFYF